MRFINILDYVQPQKEGSLLIENKELLSKLLKDVYEQGYKEGRIDEAIAHTVSELKLYEPQKPAKPEPIDFTKLTWWNEKLTNADGVTIPKMVWGYCGKEDSET